SSNTSNSSRSPSPPRSPSSVASRRRLRYPDRRGNRGPRTTDEDAILDRHLGLLVPGLGGRLLPPRHAAGRHAGPLRPPLPARGAELHVLPAADAGHAGPAGRPDAAGVSVRRQTAAHSEPRRGPQGRAAVPPGGRADARPRPAGGAAVPAPAV